LCDLLWADPMEDFSNNEMFEYNSTRGCSWNFGYGAACKFLEENKLLSIIRAHEAQDAGYRMYRRFDKTGFPAVITLFSAPNYLDSYLNKAAILRYEAGVINIRQYSHSEHPYYLPGFINVFNWSLPFVAQKVQQILSIIYKLVDDAEEEKSELQAQKREEMRAKIRGVIRMVHIFQLMRKARDREPPIPFTISRKGVNVPLSGPEVLTRSDPSKIRIPASFEAVKELDKPNEARPTLMGSQSLSHSLSESSSGNLTASNDGIRRRASRDSILNAKRSSGEKINITAILRNSSQNTPAVPQIKEEKIVL